MCHINVYEMYVKCVACMRPRGVQDDLLVSQLHDPLVTALDGVPRDHRHDDGIDALAHILDEHRFTLVQRHFKGAQHLGMAHARDLQPVVRLPVLDPDLRERSNKG